MHLSGHALRQMDEDWLEKLPVDKLHQVSTRILQDLKEARDRLNQTPDNIRQGAIAKRIALHD